MRISWLYVGRFVDIVHQSVHVVKILYERMVDKIVWDLIGAVELSEIVYIWLRLMDRDHLLDIIR